MGLQRLIFLYVVFLSSQQIFSILNETERNSNLSSAGSLLAH